MNREAIREALKAIVKPYVNDEEAFQQITEETDLIRDLQINSAHLIDIVLDIEDRFDIQIDDESIEKMITVKESVNVISGKVAHRE